jgi:hypothetical protein
MIRWLMNNELEKMWKEAVVAWFEILSENFSWGTEENHGNTHDDMFSDRGFNPDLCQYEAGMLATLPICRRCAGAVIKPII